jgi:hypothetical protein
MTRDADMRSSARLHVDPWDPAFGTGLDADERPEAASTAATNPDLEVPTDSWRPLDPPGDRRAPDVVLLVDGVRRVDARIWTEEPNGVTHPGIAASYAAGVVRCDLRSGVAEVVATKVMRGLFTPSHHATDVKVGSIHYGVQRIGSGEQMALIGGVQGRLRTLEIEISNEVRANPATSREDDLLVCDGPLQSRAQLPRSIGYIKTHQRTYLPPSLSAVITALRAGQRTPVFGVGDKWRHHSWYLRLPTSQGSPWTGIVRVECSADLTVNETVALADLSAVTLPRFASSPYKDPRAPQNLVPIAGLERKLRGLLGDARLLHRALLQVAAVQRAKISA